MKNLNSHSVQAAMVKASIKVSLLWSKGEWLSSRDIAVKLDINSLCVVERLRSELLKEKETKQHCFNEMIEFPC